MGAFFISVPRPLRKGPFVRVGGRFLAMKAADSQEELDAARTAIQTLGGRRLEDYTYTIPVV